MTYTTFYDFGPIAFHSRWDLCAHKRISAVRFLFAFRSCIKTNNSCTNAIIFICWMFHVKKKTTTEMHAMFCEFGNLNTANVYKIACPFVHTSSPIHRILTEFVIRRHCVKQWKSAEVIFFSCFCHRLLVVIAVYCTNTCWNGVCNFIAIPAI